MFDYPHLVAYAGALLLLLVIGAVYVVARLRARERRRFRNRGYSGRRPWYARI
jgi:hypothetical protein